MGGPSLLKLSFIAYPGRSTFMGYVYMMHVKALVLCCFIIVRGLIGALVIWKLILPIFILADIETW